MLDIFLIKLNGSLRFMQMQACTFEEKRL